MLWDVFDDSRWMARFLIDVEGIVTRFGVGHIFTVSQVKGDVKEVYYFLVGLDSNPQTLANMLRNSLFMSSACRGMPWLRLDRHLCTSQICMRYQTSL